MAKLNLFVSSALLLGFTACTTVPEPEALIIVLPPEPVQTCAPVSALQKVMIPAETKVQYAITSIDNPPYEPIESKVKQIRVVKPAQIIYIDSQGQEVIDICEDVEIGETGPSIGDLIPQG